MRDSQLIMSSNPPTHHEDEITPMDHQITPPSRVDTALTALTELPQPVPLGEHPDHQGSIGSGKQSRVSGAWERLRGGLGRLQTKDESQKDEKVVEKVAEKADEHSQGQPPTAALDSDDQTKDDYELAILSTVLPPLLPSMDVVAIHDIDQSPDTAWTYTPHKLFQKGAQDPHMQPVDEEDEPVEEKPSADLHVGGGETAGARRRSSLKPGLLKALKEEEGGYVHGSSSIKVWAAQVAADPQNPLPGQGTDALGFAEGDVSPSTEPRGVFDQQESSPRASRVERDGRPHHLEASNPGSHSRPRTPSEKDQKSSRWLTDPTMLAGDFSRSRIMTFSYSAPEMPAHLGSSAIPDYDSYLQKTAEALLCRLLKARAGERQVRVPLILIGSGFGCLIIQKLVSLAATRELLDVIAGVLFFDVPAPSIAEESKNDQDTLMTVFPPSTNANSRWVKAIMGTAVPKLIDSGALWESFRLVAVENNLSICWFYRVTAGKPVNPNADAVNFVPLQAVPAKSIRIHGRFLGPQDPNYIRVVDRIQASLLFKVASDRELEHLLVDLINSSLDGIYNPLMRDYKGQCPLHHAASSANDLAVTLLVSAFPHLTIAQDRAGMTPLHSIVQYAIQANPEEQDREPFKTIIEKLLGTMAELGEMDDPKDIESKSPWDYVQEDRHLWIRWLREPANLLTGARAEQDEKLGTLEPPVDGKLAVCRKSEAFLVQFYIAKNNSTDYLDRQRSTIYRLIYDPRYGAENLFRRNKRTDTEKRATCRWIHLPANNEEWVRDLFTQLRRVDRSMTGKRHEGTNYYDRYLNAGAERYKQTLELDPIPIESPAPTSPMSPARTPTGLQLNFFATPAGQKSPKLSEEFRLSHHRNHSGSFTQAPSTSSADGGTVKKGAIALFMPVLGFEEHQHRMKLRSAMKKPHGAYGKDETSMLINSYFGDEKAPLHCRRTLDQFTYHMLDDTVKRDNTQVIFRWAAKVEEQRAARSAKSLHLESKWAPQNAPCGPTGHTYPVLMIDQLWLWVLEEEETVITSFPNTWEPNSEYNLFRYLRQDLQNNDSRPLIESGFDLANLIIKSSVDFIRRQGPMRISLQEGFQASINDIAENQARLFDDFKTLVDRLNDEKLSQKKRAKYTNRLFQLTEETDFLAEIMDIQDELKTIKDVFVKQKEVLGQFVQLFAKGNQKKSAGKKKSKEQQKNHSTTELDALAPKQQSHKASKIREAAENNLNLVNSNITAVEEMTKYADKIRTELNTLLNLKQKQANVWEARFSREGSEQTQRQGNITMVFTIVTIFFLPLSFMSSLLAVQVDTFPKDADTGQVSWPVRQAMILLFGLSFAIIIPFTIVAFRVNQLSAYFGKYFHRFWPSKPTTDLPTHNKPERNLIRDDLDSDGESTASEKSGTSAQARRRKQQQFKLDETLPAWRKILGVTRSPAGSARPKSLSPSSSSSSSSSGRSRRLFLRNHLYAPLFGWEGWYFHTRIPVVRRWWKYKYYADSLYNSSSNSTSVSRSMKSQVSSRVSSSSDDSSSRDRWNDRVVRDYPLHRVMGPVWEALAKARHRKKEKREDGDGDGGIADSDREVDLQWWAKKGADMTGAVRAQESFYGTARDTAREWAITPMRKAFTFRKPAPVGRCDLEKGLPV